MNLSSHHRIIENRLTAVKRCRDGIFCYNIHDTHIGRSLDLYGEWQYQILSLLSDQIDPGDHIIDVGAYIGTCAAYFSKMVGADGVVIAIEPQRTQQLFLKANIALNTLLNVLTKQVALGDKSGSAVIPVVDLNSEHDFSGLELNRSGAGESIQVITLDSMNLAKCNLIKISPAAASLSILRGALETISSHKPAILIEIENDSDKDQVKHMLNRDRKYNCKIQSASLFNPNNYFGNSLNIFEGENNKRYLLCIPE